MTSRALAVLANATRSFSVLVCRVSVHERRLEQLRGHFQENSIQTQGLRRTDRSTLAGRTRGRVPAVSGDPPFGDEFSPLSAAHCLQPRMFVRAEEALA